MVSDQKYQRMNAIAYEIRTKADIILKSKKMTSSHLKFIIHSEDRRIFPKRILNEEIDINENNFLITYLEIIGRLLE